jgi:CBS domain-containing protein
MHYPTIVRDVMTPSPRCATPDMSVRQLAAMFAENRISGAPVVDPQGSLLGVVSRTDLFRQITRGASSADAAYLFDLLSDGTSPHTQPLPEPLIVVRDFMSEQVLTAAADDPVGPVARKMAHGRVHRVVVTDAHRRPVGIVTSLDLLKVFPLEH